MYYLTHYYVPGDQAYITVLVSLLLRSIWLAQRHYNIFRLVYSGKSTFSKQWRFRCLRR